MDMTAMNLNYICARTLLTTGSNLRLTTTLSDFNLRLLRNLTHVADQKLYNSAQKFKRLHQQSLVGIALIGLIFNFWGSVALGTFFPDSSFHIHHPANWDEHHVTACT
jgi:hypothetical protein